MSDVRANAAAKYVASIDEAELAVLMCEANYSIRRLLDGTSAKTPAPVD